MMCLTVAVVLAVVRDGVVLVAAAPVPPPYAVEYLQSLGFLGSPGGVTSTLVTPAAIRALWRLARAYPGSTWTNLRSPRPRQAVRTFLDVFPRPSLNWQDLAIVRDATKLPILLKGILHPDDARHALDEGVDGIVVSNHGGRQVDGSIGSLDALPAIVEAAGGRAPILLDSGIRGGADVFKALALGATAVLIGRPYCYGLAIAGESGVREVIQNFIGDFDLTLGLSGCASVAEIGSELVEIA